MGYTQKSLKDLISFQKTMTEGKPLEFKLDLSDIIVAKSRFLHVKPGQKTFGRRSLGKDFKQANIVWDKEDGRDDVYALSKYTDKDGKPHIIALAGKPRDIRASLAKGGFSAEADLFLRNPITRNNWQEMGRDSVIATWIAEERRKADDAKAAKQKPYSLDELTRRLYDLKGSNELYHESEAKTGGGFTSGGRRRASGNLKQRYAALQDRKFMSEPKVGKGEPKEQVIDVSKMSKEKNESEYKGFTTIKKAGGSGRSKKLGVPGYNVVSSDQTNLAIALKILGADQKTLDLIPGVFAAGAKTKSKKGKKTLKKVASSGRKKKKATAAAAGAAIAADRKEAIVSAAASQVTAPPPSIVNAVSNSIARARTPDRGVNTGAQIATGQQQTYVPPQQQPYIPPPQQPQQQFQGQSHSAPQTGGGGGGSIMDSRF